MMKCEICSAEIDNIEAHYVDKHPNRTAELVKPEPAPEPPTVVAEEGEHGTQG